jgi:hypothetical protein
MTESTLPAPSSRLAAVIAEARRRGRRRTLALAGMGLLLLGGGLTWAGLSLSGGGSAGPTVHAPRGYHVIRAQGPVGHSVFETRDLFQPVSVDIVTGAARPVRSTIEVWYDSRTRASRFVVRADGRIQSDRAQVCPRSLPAAACPGTPGFSFLQYWPLDASRYTREPGTGTFHGRPVIWIAPRQRGGFAAYPGDGERIALDSRTHEPVADRFYQDGKLLGEVQVVARKPDIPADKYAFVVQNTHPAFQEPAPLSASGFDPLALQARRTLGRTPLWLGERFDGHRLRGVTIGSTFMPPTGPRVHPAPYVQYDYGNVQILEFDARRLYGPGEGFVPGRMTLEKSQTSTSSPIADLRLVRDGVFLLGNRSRVGNYRLDRAAALRLARALRPVPQPYQLLAVCGSTEATRSARRARPAGSRVVARARGARAPARGRLPAPASPPRSRHGPAGTRAGPRRAGRAAPAAPCSG